MKSVEYNVVGMTCGGCENSVKRVVKQLEGVQDVEASHKEEKVNVHYDETLVTEGQIMSQIKKLGYEVDVK